MHSNLSGIHSCAGEGGACEGQTNVARILIGSSKREGRTQIDEKVVSGIVIWRKGDGVLCVGAHGGIADSYSGR